MPIQGLPELGDGCLLTLAADCQCFGLGLTGGHPKPVCGVQIGA